MLPAKIWLRRQLTASGLLCAALLWMLWLSPGPALAAQDNTVYFAGVAFTSAAANVKDAYPYASEALTHEGIVELNRQIQQEIRAQPLRMNVVFDGLGSIKDSSKSTALALGIDRETTSGERIGNLYKLRVEIAAQALFFDFKERQVLGGFPFIIDFIDVDTSSTPPSSAEIQKAYHDIVFGAPGQHSLASQFVSTLANIQIPNAANKHLRVTAVTLGPKAVEYIQAASTQLDLAEIQHQVAQSFGQSLAQNQHISILPYSSNKAIGSSMAARFIEGEAYQLKIPDADYEIHLNVAGFKKIDQAQSSVARVFLYGAFVDVTVTEPLSGKVYVSQRIKQGETKTVPMTQSTLENWAPARDTMLVLFDNFTKALSPGHSDWVKSGLPDTSQAKSQLSSLSELVQSCR